MSERIITVRDWRRRPPLRLQVRRTKSGELGCDVDRGWDLGTHW